MPRRTEVVITPEGLAVANTIDLQPAIFSDDNWRIMNESGISTPNQEGQSDVWGAYANNRRYVAEETARLVNQMIVEDTTIEPPTSGMYTTTIDVAELADEGRNVVQANRATPRRRVYSVDEVDATAVLVPDNVDRRCVVRADRKQGIESVKTE